MPSPVSYRHIHAVLDPVRGLGSPASTSHLRPRPSAADLADGLGPDAVWVESDVLDARAAVDGDFDLVHASIGTITWLPDQDRWAAQVAGLLRAGGRFTSATGYIRDGHPSLHPIDEHADGMTLRYPYFGNGRAQIWDDESTYVGDGKVAHSRTSQWAHPISEIINSLIGPGLQILRVDEGKPLPWTFSPRMVEFPDRYAWPQAECDLVPCTYMIIARKAGQ